jgi:hypothetical protein
LVPRQKRPREGAERYVNFRVQPPCLYTPPPIVVQVGVGRFHVVHTHAKAPNPSALFWHLCTRPRIHRPCFGIFVQGPRPARLPTHRTRLFSQQPARLPIHNQRTCQFTTSVPAKSQPDRLPVRTARVAVTPPPSLPPPLCKCVSLEMRQRNLRGEEPLRHEQIQSYIKMRYIYVPYIYIQCTVPWIWIW